MSERIMKNFPIEYDGQTYWRSRSCTVVGFIYCKDKLGNWYVLANQRGTGAPTNVGKWNVPCGYIDFNEDGEHAVSRETFEETGVKLNPNYFKFHSVTFSKSNDQNINLRYVCALHDNVIDDFELTNKYNEPNETSDIKWIPLTEINNYNWAFGHLLAIPQIAKDVLVLL